jgi:hypothetical protein
MTEAIQLSAEKEIPKTQTEEVPVTLPNPEALEVKARNEEGERKDADQNADAKDDKETLENRKDGKVEEEKEEEKVEKAEEKDHGNKEMAKEKPTLLLPDQLQAILSLQAALRRIAIKPEEEDEPFALFGKSVVEIDTNSLQADNVETAIAAVNLQSFLECWTSEMDGGEWNEEASGMADEARKVKFFLQEFANQAALASQEILTSRSRPRDLHASMQAKFPIVTADLIKKIGGYSKALEIQGNPLCSILRPLH